MARVILGTSRVYLDEHPDKLCLSILYRENGVLYLRNKIDTPNGNASQIIEKKVRCDDVFLNASDHKFKLFSGNPESVFIKTTSLFEYKPGSKLIKSILQTEIETVEFLAQFRHKGIPEYLGCFVEDGYIKGICFRKYGITLEKALMNKHLILDKANFLANIRDTVSFIHSKNLVHNDINPSNIMFDIIGDKLSSPILVDYDSCGKIGNLIGVKYGAPGWERPSLISDPENDFYSLEILEDYI
ncbi:casein kinase I-like protein [Smittium culicis]|uniref:Casein kinase I-like protein n=1 Tax=Smittium culicis TaxID=133412 RepID=A0A1R1Y1E0_9FUNG|nr:casein kinase I-like protein [Smittium culicis]